MMLAPEAVRPVNRDLEIRDLYNMEDAFRLGDVLPRRLPGAARTPTSHSGTGSTARPIGPPTEWDHPLTDFVLADFLVVDLTKPYAERGLLPRDRTGRPARRRTRDLRGPGPQRRRDGHDLHPADQRRERAAHPRRESTRPPGPPEHVPVPGSAEPGPARAARAPLAMSGETLRASDRRSASSSTTSRAARCTNDRRPTSAPTCCCASTTARRDGAGAAAAPARRRRAARRPIPPRRLDHRRLHLPGLAGARRAAGRRSTASRRSSGKGWRPGPTDLGDVGESSPEHWEKPLGTPRRPCRAGRALARRRAAGSRPRAGPPRPRRSFPASS